MKRMIGCVSGLILLLLVSCAGTRQIARTPSPEEDIVQTDKGLVQGTREASLWRFLGIPYARTPKRFVPSVPVAPWEGVLVADHYGPISPQGAISGVAIEPDQTGTDNSCQNLNIWTPALDGRKRAVMVWLHGGGFSTGSANEAAYDGAALSQKEDVVVVSINHRLNIFGHLDLSAYGEEYRHSANTGILDIVQALRWIHANIASFGGDPDNVTLFGQSGGGAKVLAMMASPMAKGLFRRGIVQSGTTETMGAAFTSREASRILGARVLQLLDIPASQVERIQEVPVDELERVAVEALARTGEELGIHAALGDAYAMDWEPVVDGEVLPTNPVTEDSFAEAGKEVPLLIGSNLNEWTGYFPQTDMPHTPEMEAVLRHAYPDKPDLRPEQVDTTLIRLPTLKIMAHKADQDGAPVYGYLFSYGNSYHGAEIPYVFAHEGSQLGDFISHAWASFAKTGVPAAQWIPYTRENGATMILDERQAMASHHDEAYLRLVAPTYQW